MRDIRDMRLGEGVEWALHSCVLLALVPPGRSLPAARLAEFHELPQAYLAKHLQALAQAGIVTAVTGRRGGYRLARPASEVRVLDVVEAVEGEGDAFRCTEIRRRGPVAAGIPAAPCVIAQVMREAEAAWRERLAATSIQDLLDHVVTSISPVAIRRSAQWLEESVR
jgi:Rrf2 family protein